MCCPFPVPDLLETRAAFSATSRSATKPVAREAEEQGKTLAASLPVT